VDIDTDDLDDIQSNKGETMMHPPPPAEEEEEEVEEEVGVWPKLDSNADVDFVLSTQVEIVARD
jgi:hypothetical protein